MFFNYNLVNSVTIENVTYVAAIAFTCFTVYKTIQFFNNSGTINDNLDLDTVSGSPTSKPESLINSVESTISSNTIPLPIPDPTPLIVPGPQPLNTVIHVWDKTLDGTNYLFAVLGNTTNTGITEITNWFM